MNNKQSNNSTNITMGGVKLIQTNLDENFIKITLSVFGHIYSINGVLPKINWILKDTTKNILGYKCHKAITTYECRTYIAWFTKELPYSFGPWELHGLPGIILQVEENTGFLSIKAKKIELKSSLKLPKKLKSLRANTEITRKWSLDKYNRKIAKMKNMTIDIDSLNSNIITDIETTTSTSFLHNCD